MSDALVLRPPDPRTTSIARVSYRENTVYAILPEKHEEFRLLVKDYGFRWDRDGRRWYRNLNSERTGPALDRAAEIGRVLLASGFMVEFPDEACRDMALDETYRPEQTRWILLRTAGDYAGWLFVQWARREDFYRQARRLSGSRYDPPGVVVPSDSFEEVEDFAEIHLFSLSQKAQQAIAEARSRQKNALVVNLKMPEPRPDRKSEPKTYEIADELLDEPLPSSTKSSG